MAKDNAVQVVQTAALEGDFDALLKKFGAQEVHFDRPIASFKKIRDNRIHGQLVTKVQLNKPKSMQVESDNLEDNLFDAYVFHLLSPCKAHEGELLITVPAGREIYIPKTAKLSDLDNFLWKPEMYTFLIAVSGSIFVGANEIFKYRTATVGEPVARKGHFLIGGPPAVQVIPPHQGGGQFTMQHGTVPMHAIAPAVGNGQPVASQA